MMITRSPVWMMIFYTTMLQENRITGQGVHKIPSSNSTELFLYNSGQQSTSHSETGFSEITFKPISERISVLATTMKKGSIFLCLFMLWQTNLLLKI